MSDRFFLRFCSVFGTRIQRLCWFIWRFMQVSIFGTPPTRNGRFCLSSTLGFPSKTHGFVVGLTSLQKLAEKIKILSQNDLQNGGVELRKTAPELLSTAPSRPKSVEEPFLLAFERFGLHFGRDFGLHHQWFCLKKIKHQTT